MLTVIEDNGSSNDVDSAIGGLLEGTGVTLSSNIVVGELALA